jgi:hypothetical protein
MTYNSSIWSSFTGKTVATVEVEVVAVAIGVAGVAEGVGVEAEGVTVAGEDISLLSVQSVLAHF